MRTRPFTLQCGLITEALALRDPLGRPQLIRHEQIIPARLGRLREDLLHAGIQTTPITVLRRSSGDHFYVADGHHRVEALESLGAEAVMARVHQLDASPPLILPAHRVVRAAPAGWLDECRNALRGRFAIAPRGALALCWRSGEERYDIQDSSAADILRVLWEGAGLDREGVEWSIAGDAEATRADLQAGALAAILVPAVSLGEVIAAGDSGRLLPPRSTNFQPKPEECSIAFPIAIQAGPSIAACANVAMRS